MESPLPHIIESMDDFGGKPKDRLVSVLDQIEMHVEQLRKDAMRIEEAKDTLLTTLDTLRNNDVIISLEDSECRSPSCRVNTGCQPSPGAITLARTCVCEREFAVFGGRGPLDSGEREVHPRSGARWRARGLRLFTFCRGALPPTRGRGRSSRGHFLVFSRTFHFLTSARVRAMSLIGYRKGS